MPHFEICNHTGHSVSIRQSLKNWPRPRPSTGARRRGLHATDALDEPKSGYFLQIVAHHAHEDRVRLRLAAELQHAGHFSRWLDCLAKISGGVIKHLSKLCARRVGRHAVGVPTAQELSSPLHFVCRVLKTVPPFSSMANGHGDAPGSQDFCDEVFGRKRSSKQFSYASWWPSSTFSRRCCARTVVFLSSCATYGILDRCLRMRRSARSIPTDAPSSPASRSSGRRAICDFNFFIELFHNLVARPHTSFLSNSRSFLIKKNSYSWPHLQKQIDIPRVSADQDGPALGGH
jgi:hypothetical protein